MAQSGRDPRRLSTTARFALVQEIAARLAESHGLEEVVPAIRLVLEAGLGVDAFVLNLASEDRTQLLTLTASGTSDRTLRFLQKPVPLEDNTPASVVLASGAPVYWRTLEERNRAFPNYSEFPSSCQCWALLPLTVHGSTFGVLSVGWRESRRFDPAVSALLQLIAQLCAVAVDRAKIEEVERAERETLELMSEGTRLMVSDLDRAMSWNASSISQSRGSRRGVRCMWRRTRRFGVSRSKSRSTRCWRRSYGASRPCPSTRRPRWPSVTAAARPRSSRT